MTGELTGHLRHHSWRLTAVNRGAPGWWRRERPSHQISNYAPWTPPRVFLSRPKYNTPRETRKHRHVRNQLPGDPRADTGSGGRRVEVRKFPLSPCAAQTGRERRWKRRYDMRHQCQEILPGLLLGPFQVSKDLASLKELGISHMYASCPPRPLRIRTLSRLFLPALHPESAFAMSKRRSQFARDSPDASSISS